MALSDDMRQAGVDSELCDRAAMMECRIGSVELLLRAGLSAISELSHQKDERASLPGFQERILAEG